MESKAGFVKNARVETGKTLTDDGKICTRIVNGEPVHEPEPPKTADKEPRRTFSK